MPRDDELREVINQAQHFLPGDKDELFERLKVFPDEIDKWLFSESKPGPGDLKQGDLVLDIPVCLVTQNGHPAKSIKKIILLSNTCDLQPSRKDYVLASPIFEFDKYAEKFKGKSEEAQKNKMLSLKKNRIFNLFYLPNAQGLSESFVDFTKIVSINSKWINELKKKEPSRVSMSLSTLGEVLLLVKLIYHFARFSKKS